MKIGDTEIEDTFAEAFRMMYTRLVVTAADGHWLGAALSAACGYGTSVLGCDAEVGVERRLGPSETFDGRLGATVLVFGFNAESAGNAAVNRVGQCVLTCPTTAVFDGISDGDSRVPLGEKLRFFGDGFQKSKLVGERRIWRIPVMDGEFLVDDSIGVAKGVAGGNFMIQSVDQSSGLEALRRALAAIESIDGVIAPFPGGAVRSGSKVGSKYAALKASTNHEFCPSLRSQVASKIHPSANCVYEIVIDGVSEDAIRIAMAAGIRAAAGPKIPVITAGNYGGKLGKFHFRLHDVLNQTA